MDNLQWKGQWNQLKGKVKKAYAELTEDDLKYEEGQEDQLLGRIQEKTGKTKVEIEEWFNQMINSKE